MNKTNQRENTYRRLSRILAVVYAVTGVGIGIYNILYSTPYYILLSFASLLFLLIPPAFNKIVGIKPVYSLNFTVILFCFLAFMLGMVFDWYHVVPQYDKIAHTLSGVFFGMIGLVFFYLLKKEKKIEKSDCPLAIFSSVTFALSTAAIWEMIEFTLNLVLGNDCQNVAATGVTDTMMDMIVCFAGALLFLIPLALFYKKGRRGLLMGVFEDFFNAVVHK